MRRRRWRMVLVGPVLAIVLLAGCKREPSFDERFGKAEAQVRRKAAQIDADLARREKEAAEADALDRASPAAALPTGAVTPPT